MTSTNSSLPQHGDCRVIIDRISPSIDGGLFPIKRVVGDSVKVEADVFADGHDSLVVILQYRKCGDAEWLEEPMEFKQNDLYTGEFWLKENAIHEYNVCAWIDHFETWLKGLNKKIDAQADVALDMLIGADLLEAAAARATEFEEETDADALNGYAEALRDETHSLDEKISLATSTHIAELARTYPDRSKESRWHSDLPLYVERERAAFSSWYEFFPRSWGEKPGKHGTFKSAAKLVLPEVKRMGFNVVYLPPIHPIGTVKRKGKNNSLTAGKDDVGSPWAIGNKDGGHKDVNPLLGTLEDFDQFVSDADKLGLEVALDIAFQCAPDHPYVKEHPEWFSWRPDGTVQYAENPPKKYEDILPFNFECAEWKELWEELKSVFEFWIARGVKIFRVDNPHTKPSEFWRWCIHEIKKEHPEAIFLAEAFTRPKLKYRLGKCGFTHGYTYFTWRNTKDELTEYLTQLKSLPTSDIFWPNFWPNTPDILHEVLQYGGTAAHKARLILAATMSSNFGLYGPAFELCEHEAFPGKEEYNHNEKYEIKQWDWDREGNLKDLMARINKIRLENPALHRTFNIEFVETDNPSVIAFLKKSPDLLNIVLVVVSLDFYNVQEGWLTVPLADLELADDAMYLVQDMLPASDSALPDSNYMWTGARNYFKLSPENPAHIFRVFRKHRKESDFDYWL